MMVLTRADYDSLRELHAYLLDNGDTKQSSKLSELLDRLKQQTNTPRRIMAEKRRRLGMRRLIYSAPLEERLHMEESK